VPRTPEYSYDVTAPYIAEPAGLIIPTAEFVNPYDELTEEQKVEMMKQFEPPPRPPVVDVDSSTFNS
jgi:hypothetical protein